jgi:hypothetical protein
MAKNFASTQCKYAFRPVIRPQVAYAGTCEAAWANAEAIMVKNSPESKKRDFTHHE